MCVFFFQAEDGIRDRNVTGVQTCALPICPPCRSASLVLWLVRPALLSSQPALLPSIALPAPSRAMPRRREGRRSEERRVGKECRCRLSADHSRNKVMYSTD